VGTPPIGPIPAVQALASSLALGFKFLAWVNGLGVAAMLLFSVGIVPMDLAPQWLRMPMAAFLGGMALCALGLLWSYPVQASLLNQLISGRARKTHWVPLLLAMLAYSFSLLAFIVGCWFTLGLASIVYQGPGG
jgi:hypothetical protein